MSFVLTYNGQTFLSSYTVNFYALRFLAEKGKKKVSPAETSFGKKKPLLIFSFLTYHYFKKMTSQNSIFRQQQQLYKSSHYFGKPKSPPFYSAPISPSQQEDLPSKGINEFSIIFCQSLLKKIN